MRKPAPFLVIVFLALYAWNSGLFKLQPTRIPDESAERGLAEAFQQRRSDVQVQGRGRVQRILPDDLKGSKHQRFILQLESGQTILIAHNIDLADRIPNLQTGDMVEFYGEYEWNPQGGVVHWTHHDPGGRHEDGWLRHEGRRFQ